MYMYVNSKPSAAYNHKGGNVGLITSNIETNFQADVASPRHLDIITKTYHG